ncbi:MAG TPA: PAS domain-containing sensor histidine kinase [Alphaproteobacteria bacterium]|nr:PAS domain-containing sensor histidine kinase [Alphaproteobacteria bacterium]
MSDEAIEARSAAPWRGFVQWSARVGLGNKVAVALIVMAVMAGAATYAALTADAPFGDPHTIILLLTFDLILFLMLGLIVARRIVALWVKRRQGTAGARLHVKFVTWFSIVAVVPAILVALFSIGFFYLGVESWFGEQTRTAVNESVVVATAYLQEHEQAIRGDILAMANDLNTVPVGTPEFRAVVAQQALIRNLSDAIVFDAFTGQVFAGTGFTFELGLDLPQVSEIDAARRGEVRVMTSPAQDRVTALIRLYGETYLYVARPVDQRVLAHTAIAKAASARYAELEGSRSSLQIRVWLMFIVVALLLLLAAIWLGLHFARSLVQPVSELIEAAEQVRAGDLTTRIKEPDAGDELALLTRTFNRMTSQLGSQRAELMEANRQLDVRRRFTETVLAGVSAGVLGLDLDGRITLANRTAAEFFGTDQTALVGQPLAEILPELEPVLDQLAPNNQRLVQYQFDLKRPGLRDRSLLVRIGAEQGRQVGGYVATFDDVTELLQAQRKAAWADVARRIAHEIKNPLTPIQLSAERLKRKYLKEIQSDPDTFKTCTDTIVRQVGDIGRMVDEFSAFARMPQPVIRPESLGDLIDQAVFLQRQAHPLLKYEVRKPNDAVIADCDSRQIAQALTNLLQNASDAIDGRSSEGGLALPRGLIEVELTADAERAFIIVADNGKGLPLTGRDRLTEPYVTTRVKGTGLGLAIVKKIMEDHAGSLDMQDNSGGGARVVLSIPLHQPSQAKATQQKFSTQLRYGA